MPIGASDCELIRRGLVSQRFNTVTSAGYFVAAALILAWQRRTNASTSALVFAALVGLEGVGSVAYHALTNAPARWLHDDALLGALAFVAAYEVALLTEHDADRTASDAGIGGAVVMGAVLVVWPGATDVALIVLLAVGAVAYAARRVRYDWPPSRGDLPFTVLTIVTVGVFVLGRTGSPLCRSDSWFQFHGIWHLGTAVMATFWAITTIGVRERTAPSAGTA